MATITLPTLKTMSILKSPRFWVTVVAAGVEVANKSLGLGISSGTITDFTGTAIAFILGDSYVHGKFVSNQTTTPATTATTASTPSNIVTTHVS